MKKAIVFACVYLIVAFSFNKTVSADESGPLYSNVRIETYISDLYKQIDFSQCGCLSFEVFDKAYRGYLNLRNAGKLNADKEIISVCDFNLSSTENRLWIIDLAHKKVLFNTFVAHGQGSGEEFARSFSNKDNSHQSSLGFYVTGDTYEGEHGTSLHLSGMDQGFNDAAYDRSIVVHGADYVCNKFVSANQRLGRSWGCPAVPSKLSLPIINTIKEGTCLFIFYPESKYLKTSYWLNKKVALPENSVFASIAKPDASKPKTKIIEYISNGKVDSVKTISVAQ